MMKKIFKLFFVFAIGLSFAQNNTSLNLTIEGMHCAGGCAKMIENSLNQNEGISAAVDFQNSSAAIIYDSELFSKTALLKSPRFSGKGSAPRLNLPVPSQ